jgi:hypothetical protein
MIFLSHFFNRIQWSQTFLKNFWPFFQHLYKAFLAQSLPIVEFSKSLPTYCGVLPLIKISAQLSKSPVFGSLEFSSCLFLDTIIGNQQPIYIL